MRFTISRAELAKKLDYAGLILGHHIINASKARVHAWHGHRETARWYGEQARQDLTSYLKLTGHQT